MPSEAYSATILTVLDEELVQVPVERAVNLALALIDAAVTTAAPEPDAAARAQRTYRSEKQGTTATKA